MEEQIEEFIEYLATQKTLCGQYADGISEPDLLQFHQFVMNMRPYTSSWARVDSLLMQALAA